MIVRDDSKLRVGGWAKVVGWVRMVYFYSIAGGGVGDLLEDLGTGSDMGGVGLL